MLLARNVYIIKNSTKNLEAELNIEFFEFYYYIV